jgi:hypothetical protein
MRLCLVGLSLLIPFLAPQAHAQPATRANPVFIPDAARAVAAATSVIGLRDPVGATAILLMGKSTLLWDDTPVFVNQKNSLPDQNVEIDPVLLGGVEDGAPVRNANQNDHEALAYNYVLVHAHQVSVRALARAARRDLTYAHLFEEPGKYRGQIVHLEGRLRRLRRFDAPALAAKDGVPTIYEGWIFDDIYYKNPYCVVISELPDGLAVGDKLNHHVAYDGYFFKRYRYPGGDVLRDAPLLIGRTLTVQPQVAAVPESASPLAFMLLTAFLGLVAFAFLLMVGLSWWFRRGDRQVRARLEQVRANRFVDPGEAGK